jgi:hypothetical protein
MDAMLKDLAQRGNVTITSFNDGKRWLLTLVTRPGSAGHVTWEGTDPARVIAGAHEGAVGGLIK